MAVLIGSQEGRNALGFIPSTATGKSRIKSVHRSKAFLSDPPRACTAPTVAQQLFINVPFLCLPFLSLILTTTRAQ